MASLEVRRGEVVQDDAPLLEVTPGQPPLDPILALQQPVHGGVELVLVGVLDAEHGPQRGRAPAPRRRQLGAGREEAGGDHPHAEIALPGRRAVEQQVETEAAQRAQHRDDVAVGEAALQHQLAGGEELLARQPTADDVDEVGREVGDVADGLVLDLAAFAIGAAQQVALVDPVLVASTHPSHVDAAAPCCHEHMVAHPTPSGQEFLVYI